MNIKNQLLILSTIVMLASCSGQPLNPFKASHLAPTEIAGYTLVFNDEFDKDGKPDPSKWTYENGFVRNEELQWYQPSNANCKNGVLLIEGRREIIKNPGYNAASGDWKLNRPEAYLTSASIQTKGLHQWKFGRFEIRARIDTTMGSWPAIWTLGADKEWPSNGEIDIMEFYRIQEVPTILANVAWGTTQRYVAKWDSEKWKLAIFLSADKEWNKKFHTWRMDWDETAINLYLDDVLMNSTLVSQTINPDGSNPFLQPHYLLLNLALGGNGGQPAKSGPPFTFEVDYVRVYQHQ